MKVGILIGSVALCLAGCDSIETAMRGPPEIEACTAYTKAQLAAPTTFKLISTISGDKPISLPDFERKYLPSHGDDSDQALTELLKLKAEQGITIRTVVMEFDAENKMGVPLRSAQSCEFALFGGKLPARDKLLKAAEDASDRREFGDWVDAGVVKKPKGYRVPESYKTCCATAY